MRFRPKKVDIDKPYGFEKYKLRRWFRRLIKRETLNEVRLELDGAESVNDESEKGWVRQ